MTCYCKYFHKATSAAISDSKLVISFADATDIKNKERFCFGIPVALPAGYETLPVYLVVNGANVPLLDRYGNQAKGSELSRCTPYPGFFGNETTAHVIGISTPRVCSCGCEY